jgi:hypothetical protein
MSSITEFDKLEINDLLKQPSKELLVCIFIKIKQQNGKVKFHDWVIKGLLGTFTLGIMAAIIIGIIG